MIRADTQASGPPPSRAPPARKPPAPTPTADVQAQALYDYEAGDSNDLGVQAGQVVYVVQKTSADCESYQAGAGSWSRARLMAQGGHARMRMGKRG